MRGEAIRLARRGFRVFPLQRGSKKPLPKSDWVRSATNDGFLAMELWSESGGDAGYNIGILTTGLVVLDVDVKGSVDGQVALAELGELPATYTVETPSGGRHYYFDACGQSYGQHDLAKGVNIRSTNGYVVGPGSVIEGRPYRVVVDAPVAPLPEHIAERLRHGPTRDAAAGIVVGELDTPGALSAARAWLLGAPGAVQGERDNRAYQVACRIYDFGASPETCRELLSEWNENKCDPPLNDHDLDRIYASAAKSRQSAIGRDNPLLGFKAPPEPPAEPDPFEARVKPFRQTEQELAEIPVRPWLADRRLLRGKISTLVAPGSIGKSLLTLQWAAALALGDGSFCGLTVKERCNVLVLNNEDEQEELDRRLGAVCQHFSLDRAQLWDRIFTFSGATDPWIAVHKQGKHGGLSDGPGVWQLHAFCVKHQIGAIIVDPLVDTHEADENSNAEMSRVMRTYRALATATQAAVLLVHHTKKPPGAAVEAFAGNMDAGRGASAVVNAARVSFTLFNMGKKDAERYGLEGSQHRYVRLDDAKANLFLANPDAQWFRRDSVQLPNGESSGVLVPVALTERGQEDDAPLIVAAALDMVASGSITVGELATALSEDPFFGGVGRSTLIRRILRAFKTPREGLVFRPKGDQGGTIRAEKGNVTTL